MPHHLILNHGTQSDVITLYIDGVAVLSGNVAGQLNNEAMKFQMGGGYQDQYFDEIRHTQGIARYSANFTPPTKAFSTHA